MSLCAYVYTCMAVSSMYYQLYARYICLSFRKVVCVCVCVCVRERERECE